MPSRMQLCSACGKKCRATLNMCPTCCPTTKPEFPKLTYGPLKEFTATPDNKARLTNRRGFFVGPVGQGIDVAEIHCTASQKLETQERFARLFAASPDLLAALETLLESFGHPGGLDFYRKAEAAAKAAIAKAKGTP